MEKVTFINSLGEPIEFAQSAPLILQRIGGTGGLNYNIQKEKSPYQDGSSFVNMDADDRDIPIQVALLGSQAEVFQAKRDIQRIINPSLEKGYLVYQNSLFEKRIPVYVDGSASYAAGDRSKGQDYQIASLSFVALEPFWNDISPFIEFLTRVTPLFHFKLDIDIDSEGIEFGTYTDSIADINNDGDVEAPLRFEFRGPVVNPVLTNQTTGEFISLITPLLADETMIITTDFGNKRAEIHKDDGTIINAFQYLDLASTFFQLQRGQNKLIFDAAEGSTDATILITYNKRYIGL